MRSAMSRTHAANGFGSSSARNFSTAGKPCGRGSGFCHGSDGIDARGDVFNPNSAAAAFTADFGSPLCSKYA